MNTVVTSILTSAVVSLFTFVLGLKSGKNQADRAFLQELYKNLYVHFSELEVGIKEKRPKRWKDYKEINKEHTIEYFPLVKEMKRTGDILYLKKKIADKASQLELDCLNYSLNLDELCKKVHEYFLECPELFDNKLVDETYDKKNSPLIKLGTANPTGCKTYRYFTYGVLVDKEKLLEQLNERDASDQKYALDFALKGNPSERELVIYPCSLAVDNETFAKKITEYANGEFNTVAAERDILERIEKLKKIVAKRAKNPTGFWETFVGAFLDIFH